MTQHSTPPNSRDTQIPGGWDRRGLPTWCYRSEALLDLEKTQLFLRHWQLVCHSADLPEPGDYLALDVCAERALIVHGRDGLLRGFHNQCRHRGSRLVTDEQGHCDNALVCPFHGWSYEFDGRLRGIAQPASFPSIDKSAFGLKPVELEVWSGFVFIRFMPGPQPSVATLMAPFDAEISHYQIDAVQPADGMWQQVSDVNWKTVRDVDNEGYHVAVAHPSLQDLYGSNYLDEPYINGVSRSYARCQTSARLWTARHYMRLTTTPAHFPDYLHNAWLYYGLFPNLVIALTPESVQFYQEFPLSTTRTLLRGAVYRFADETRQQRLARYLVERIDRVTQYEDVALTQWSSEALDSQVFSGVMLSDLEYGLRTHHDHLRNQLPVCVLPTSPGEADMAITNTRMLEAGSS